MKNSIRVATWNIGQCSPRSGNRATDYKKRIEEENADVWILTETHLEFSPGDNYLPISHSATAADLDAKGKRWVGIWSRLPAEKVELTEDLERCAAAKIGTSLYIVGTVLPWSNDPHPETSTWLDHFKSRLTKQSIDWSRLGSESGMSLCVAGDFNQDLLAKGSCYGPRGGREVLRQTLEEVNLKCLTAGADDPLATVEKLGSIDHISVRGLQAKGSPHVWPEPGKLKIPLKEHYGVWVDLIVSETSS